jgi:hypothetical protein
LLEYLTLTDNILKEATLAAYLKKATDEVLYLKRQIAHPGNIPEEAISLNTKLT